MPGGSLLVGNYHGIARPGSKLDNDERLEQSRAIRRALDAHDGPVVLIGDFNLLPDTESVRLLEAGLRNRTGVAIITPSAFAESLRTANATGLARQLAGDGWRVVQKDLLGCGDSGGDFSEASWAAWIEDIAAELREADSDRPVWLWCVRAGALLVPDLLAGRPHLNLLLWHPVVSGAQHLQPAGSLGFGLDHRAQCRRIVAIAREHLEAQREALTRHHQADANLLAIRPMIAAVAAACERIAGSLPLEIGARHIV